MPANSFRPAFETKFMPSITFVDMGELFADHPLAVKVRMVRNGKGASDVPTAQLAVLLSRLRPVTYSHDAHLNKSGVAPRPANLLTAHGAEHRVEQGEHIQSEPLASPRERSPGWITSRVRSERG